ncbi:hypothetical protein RI543_000551 [Arxiozyma heterogenica]|uniref:Uncharacterized protein n=1 Tax=Arxiozyma heterogenica TaxID=278026 RepID=A0AAN7WP41_9SACH|nr:hypothetical protein RI543_000551 [Kazachstania heterogenica]
MGPKEQNSVESYDKLEYDRYIVKLTFDSSNLQPIFRVLAIRDLSPQYPVLFAGGLAPLAIDPNSE